MDGEKSDAVVRWRAKLGAALESLVFLEIMKVNNSLVNAETIIEMLRCSKTLRDLHYFLITAKAYDILKPELEGGFRFPLQQEANLRLDEDSFS